ncbi:hypothetical protein [Microvirga arabica]|uniref:hypothetical protein n=1 Tax=Microvirga arabica TaxID=1128671 RepID=UPI001939F822|nr:hypothetical protein [Microvirga arabica]MBM1169408.1 hypothetical protein [Microvirga arabica]
MPHRLTHARPRGERSKTNEQAQELFSRVRSADPDLLLVLETDQWWDERLAQLGDQFPNRVQHIPQGHAFSACTSFRDTNCSIPR